MTVVGMAVVGMTVVVEKMDGNVQQVGGARTARCFAVVILGYPTKLHTPHGPRCGLTTGSI